MEKVKYFKRKSLLKVDTLSEGFSECSIGSKGSSQVRKVQKLIEETEEIRKKRIVEEYRRNRIKLALVLHQQMYNELELAAIYIQKCARRYLAVKTVKNIRNEKMKFEMLLNQVQQEIGDYWLVDNSLRHMAAYKIQRYWKGFRKTGPRNEIVQKLAKRFLAFKLLKKMQKIRENKKLAVKKIYAYRKKWVLAKLLKNFDVWKSFQREESEGCSSDDKEGSESKENIGKVEENLEKTEENLVICVNPEKTQIKVPLEPSKPKPFVLGEANFHKQTLVSKFKRFDSPLEVPKKEKKIKKIKSTKRRLAKQTTSRAVNFLDNPKPKPKREKSATTRKTPETVICPPPLPKNQNAKNKIRESLIKQSQRSSSYSIEYKDPVEIPPIKQNSNVVGEKQLESQLERLRERPYVGLMETKVGAPVEKTVDKAMENPEKVVEKVEEKEKNEFTLPTLGFKQALPELYSFLESYKPGHKKNPVIQSTAGLVVYKLKNS